MSSLAREHQAINLSQGFPNFDCPEALKSLVNQYMQQGFNQYAPMPGVPLLRERLAEKMGQLYGAQINPDTEITITAGATQAIYTIIAAFVSPGDEVILIEPAYDSYRPSVEVNGGIPVTYELMAPDYRIDWEAFAELITPRTRMIIINTPHNPTGTTLAKEDLEALQNLLADTDILLLSDEVYEHLVYDGQAHQSALRFPALWPRTLATFSFGKTFHNTGWKLGYAVAPQALMKEFRKVHQFNVFSVNTPIQHALADYLEDPAVYQSLSSFYQQKRDHFLKVMEGSRFRPIHCAGTYFQLMDYAAISDLEELDFARWLTETHKVATIPVSAFYTAQKNNKVIRFCFAKTNDLLEQAGAVLRNV